MADKPEMKSAYEIALERLGAEGIRPPSDDALDDVARAEMAAVRRRAEADLAQLEILHRDRLLRTRDPAEARTAQERYLSDRRRIEAERDRRLRDLRQDD